MITAGFFGGCIRGSGLMSAFVADLFCSPFASTAKCRESLGVTDGFLTSGPASSSLTRDAVL